MSSYRGTADTPSTGEGHCRRRRRSRGAGRGDPDRAQRRHGGARDRAPADYRHPAPPAAAARAAATGPRGEEGRAGGRRRGQEGRTLADRRAQAEDPGAVAASGSAGRRHRQRDDRRRGRHTAPAPGAGGSGSGRGGGGDYSKFTPARRISKIPDREYRRLAATGIRSGSVGVTVKVNTDGSVSNCRIARTSGDASIDALMCQLTLRYVRFSPARDDRGRPVAQDITFYPNWYR